MEDRLLLYIAAIVHHDYYVLLWVMPIELPHVAWTSLQWEREETKQEEAAPAGIKLGCSIFFSHDVLTVLKGRNLYVLRYWEDVMYRLLSISSINPKPTMAVRYSYSLEVVHQSWWFLPLWKGLVFLYTISIISTSKYPFWRCNGPKFANCLREKRGYFSYNSPRAQILTLDMIFINFNDLTTVGIVSSGRID